MGGVTRSSSLPRVAVGGALWLHVHVDGVPLLLLFGWCCTGGRRDACYCLVSLKAPAFVGVHREHSGLLVVLHACCGFVVAVQATLMLYTCCACGWSSINWVVMCRPACPQLCWRRRCSCAVHAAGKPVWRCSWVTTKHTNSTAARSACCAKPSPIGDSLSATLSSAAGNRHDYRYRKPAGHTFSATRRGQHHERAEPLTCCARQRVARCTQPGTMLAEH